MKSSTACGSRAGQTGTHSALAMQLCGQDGVPRRLGLWSVISTNSVLSQLPHWCWANEHPTKMPSTLQPAPIHLRYPTTTCLPFRACLGLIPSSKCFPGCHSPSAHFSPQPLGWSQQPNSQDLPSCVTPAVRRVGTQGSTKAVPAYGFYQTNEVPN